MAIVAFSGWMAGGTTTLHEPCSAENMDYKPFYIASTSLLTDHQYLLDALC